MEDIIVKAIVEYKDRNFALVYELVRAEGAAEKLVQALPDNELYSLVISGIQDCNYYITDKMCRIMRLTMDRNSAVGIRTTCVFKKLLYIRDFADANLWKIKKYIELIKNCPHIANRARLQEFFNPNYLDHENIIRFKRFLDEKILKPLRSFNDECGREMFLQKLSSMEENAAVTTQQLVERLRGLVRLFGSIKIFQHLNIQVMDVEEFCGLSPQEQLAYYKSTYYALLHYHTQLSSLGTEFITNYYDVVRTCSR